MIKLLRKIGNFFNPFVRMSGSKENRDKGSGARYLLNKKKGILFVYFKKAPLIGKVFQDGKYHLRVISKKLSGGRWKCQVLVH